MTAQMVILRGQQSCRRWLARPGVRKALDLGKWMGSGFFLAGAGLGRQSQPFVLGLLTAVTGWRCVAAGLGAMAGYLCFWGRAGIPGVLWSLLGLLTGALPAMGNPLLVPALCGLWTGAASLWHPGDGWLLRIALGAGSAALGPRLRSLLFPEVRPPGLWLRWSGTGAAQVRLERMARVQSRIALLLSQSEPSPIDEAALLEKTRQRACSGCPLRKKCDAQDALPAELLRSKPEGLPQFGCRKPGRMLTELHRTRERLRLLRANREKCGEYRAATALQHRFLAHWLRSQADALVRREHLRIRYRPDWGTASSPRGEVSGDTLLTFQGEGGSWYLLLCDGMGTGPGAAQTGREGAELLRELLLAGFPAEEAIASLNSLLTLRDNGGAVTVDLCRVSLSTGNVTLYKWGAAPSRLLDAQGGKIIGTAGPPPGLGVEKSHMAVHRLSLRGGEVLILFSDGVDGTRAMGDCPRTLPPGELAAALLAESGSSGDDATVAVLRLQ